MNAQISFIVSCLLLLFLSEFRQHHLPEVMLSIPESSWITLVGHLREAACGVDEIVDDLNHGLYF
jgi:hypothetical protein